MQRLEVSGAVRPIYGSGVKRLTDGRSYGEYFYRLHCGILNYSVISARIDEIKCGVWVS